MVLTTIGTQELVPRAGEEQKAHAETDCNDKTGKMGAPWYSQAVKLQATKCIQNMIIAHEHDHYFDPKLNAACKKRSEQKKAGTYNEAAVREWNAAVKASECEAYAKDAECLKKLVECCTRENETDAKKKKQHSDDCCKCRDVDIALANAEAAAKDNGCSITFPKPAGKAK